MNTFEQITQLCNELNPLIDRNKGTITLTFYDGSTITAKVRNAETNLDYYTKTYTSIIYTFTDNINQIKEYDLSLVKKIS